MRPATTDDIAALVELHRANGTIEQPAYYHHLVATGVVVVDTAGGTARGFAARIDRSGHSWIADLYVHPDAHGEGRGRALLDAVLDGAHASVATHSSGHPSALPLYAAAGLLPRHPALYLTGSPDRLPPVDAGPVVSDAATVAAFEHDLTGEDRLVDHRLWASAPRTSTFMVLAGDRVVAAGHASPEVVHHLATAPDASDDERVASVIAALRSTWSAGPQRVLLGGSHPAVPVLLRAGYRIADLDHFCSNDPHRALPTSLVRDPGLG